MSNKLIKSKPKKKNYYWQGYDADAKWITGSIKTYSLEEAKEYLSEKDIYLKSIKLEKKSQFSLLSFLNKFNLFKKDRSVELYYFTKQLHSLLNAGLNLEKSVLSMQKTIKNHYTKTILTEIHFDLTRGLSFDECLDKHPNFFPKIYLSLIKVAAQSRKFNQTLASLTDYLKKKNKLNQEMKKALFYPKVIFWVSIGLSIILLIKVVPVFEQIYQNSRSFNEIPGLTLIILKISNALTHYLEWILLSLVLFYGLIRFILNLRLIQEIIDAFIISLPSIGDLVMKSNVARIFRMISTLEKSKVSLVESIQLVADNTKNMAYKNALIDISRQVSSGALISKSFAKYSIFPEYAIQMINTGENTNQFSSMLESIAEMYEAQINDALEKMKTLIEPVSMLFLSLIVAVIVIGMYLPIFSMGSIL